MIDHVTWTQGKEMLIPYFGQDFGGEAEDKEIGAGEEDKEEEEEEDGSASGSVRRVCLRLE